MIIPPPPPTPTPHPPPPTPHPPPTPRPHPAHPHTKQWKIIENKTKHIFTIFQHLKLTFESLDLESHSTCRFDAVKIYKPGQTDPLLVACGNVCSPTLLLNSSAALVVFKTDHSQGRNGFRLRYETVSPSEYLFSATGQSTCDVNILSYWNGFATSYWCNNYVMSN